MGSLPPSVYPPGTGAAAPDPPLPRLVVVSLLSAVAIVVVDWLTSAGVVVGILLAVPIILSSMTAHPRWVWITGVVSGVGYAAAAVLGRGPVAPPSVWVPNRVIAALSLPAVTILALALQRRRRDAESTRDLNQLLLSLLAHDLRAPLQLSAQAMDYVRDQIQAGRVPEPALVADTAERTHRSLGAIEAVLAFARREAETAGETSGAAAAAGEVRDEVASFSATAARAGKELRFADGAAVTAAVGNPLVLRQVLSILLDNAVRYASPGVVAVSLAAEGREVVTRVADGGPGFSVHRSAGRGDGAGLGIELAAALARRAGGRLELESDGPAGTRWALHLPAVRGR